MPRYSDDSDDMSDAFAASDSDGSEGFVPAAKKKAAAPKAAKEAAPKKAPAAKKKPAEAKPHKEPLVPMHTQESSPPRAEPKAEGAQGKKNVEDIYQKKTQLEHILLRPDTYIGSVERQTTAMWVLDADNKMVHRPVSFVPGLYKIFDEILVNAADNKIRDPNMDTLKVDIDRENNVISIYNNGRGIPIEMHAKEGVYVPELIFGHLLTSSNYDDAEKKVVGGRNGYGAKLCNIFSNEFIIETADKSTMKKYKQVFQNNMSKTNNPVITSNAKGDEWTKVTFKPDLSKFGMTHMDEDLEALLKRRVYDMCGSIKDVKVWLNGERLRVKDFKQYIDLYLETVSPKPPLIYERVNDRWEVGFAVSEGQFQQVSFVNSIFTSKGGTHTTYVADQLVTKIQEAASKKNKNGAPLKPFQIKSHMWLFVNCLVENPTFDSQTKENMTLRASAFGSKCPLSEDFVKKVLKSGIIDSVLSLAKYKQEQQMKKTDGSKKSRISGIAKLDDANNAGTKNAGRCTLILTEGDSAKALAVSGLSVVGRDDYGVFPLRGKLLNVREANSKQLLENQEIQHIKQILGLQQGKKYEDVSSLRYGHLMIMTDQDHDGSHIKGLILNFLDHFWPSLLNIKGFLQEFITPIVKATKGKGKDKKEISFFTLPEYQKWREANDNGRGWTIKYYKGLGTSTSEDAKKYFANMQKHRKSFQKITDDDRGLIDMAFSKKKADDRKDWLRRFKPGTHMDHDAPEIPISDFINKELVLFSVADNVRSIPSVVDGLKPGHRKIVFACFKRNLRLEIKVAQLAGYVAEHSAYHHGEASLGSTIVGLAQNFVGSNNINLLEPIGQFGTRLQGGKDAASARYIFTNLTAIARSIFHSADDALLAYLDDDGQRIEPEWYVPVIPMVLVNGSEGIGTGWSSFVPNYDPREIVSNLRHLMADEPMQRMDPWYRGFKGTIEMETAERYRVTGIIRKLNDTTVEITELPIKVWTQSYKEQLETWMAGTEKSPAWIKDYKEYHTDTNVHFIITLSAEEMAKAEEEGLEKRFKLSSTLSLSNMVCFDKEGRIHKYATPEEILEDFYHLRLSYYQKRKDHLLDVLNQDWTKLDNKLRFVLEIIQGKLVVQNRKKVDILAELKKRDYVPFAKGQQSASDAPASPAEPGEDSDEDGAEGNVAAKASVTRGYDYLLSMPIWNLTLEYVQKLTKERDEKRAELDALLRKTPQDLWNTDLDVFLERFEALERELAEASLASAKKMPHNKGIKKLGKPSKPKKTSRLSDSDEMSEDIEDDDDDDDEFEVAKKPVQRPPAAKKPAALAAPAAKPPVAAKDPVKGKSAAVPAIEEPVAKPVTAKRKSIETSESEDESEKESFASKITRLMGAQGSSAPAPFAAPSVPVAKPKVEKAAAPASYAFEISSDEDEKPVKKVVAKAGKAPAPPKKTAAAAVKPAAGAGKQGAGAGKPKAPAKRKVESDDDEEEEDEAGAGAPAARPARARKVISYKVQDDDSEGVADKNSDAAMETGDSESEDSFDASDSDDD